MNSDFDSTAGSRPDSGGVKITITLNGSAQLIAANSTVADVAELVLGPERAASGAGVAVAVDEAVIPRSLWPSTVVPAQARVEVLTAFLGG